MSSESRVAIAEPSKNEQELMRALESVARSALETPHANGNGTGEAAERLGMIPYGVEVLLERQNWRLETSIRVINALGYTVDLEITER